MTPQSNRRTLRRTLLEVALLVGVIAVAVMVGSLSLAMSMRDAVERDSDAFTVEQRIADQIVAQTYEQQLAAYRFLQHPDSAYLQAFRVAGDRAYSEIRGYLFHALSTDARLQVENIKETHQRFEVAAERIFDLVRQRRMEDARRRLSTLDREALELDFAVRRFRDARSRQRAEFRHEHQVLASRLRYGLGLVVGALFLLVVVLTTLLRARVLRPLDHLATAARRLGEGDTSARVPAQPYEEFDAVAAGFNQMADRVHAARAKMEVEHEELQSALRNLRQTQEELVQHEKLSAMGQMLAGLAHELNNPLAGILGMSECLRAELAESPHADARRLGVTLAAPLEMDALRARTLVQSLLSFARKPSGTIEPVGLAAAVSIAVGLRAHAFAQAGKTLHVDVAPELQVLADTQKLQHAVVNVVNNALDAVVAGHGTGLRIYAACDEDGFIRVEFDDDGSGMTDPAAVFTPFYTTKKPGEGTGLGLALVKRFVTEAGGKVSAVNRHPRGARVTIRLRGSASTARADAAPLRDSALRRSGPASRPNSGVERILSSTVPSVTTLASSDAAHRSRVLVVDDEPAIREVQRRLLTRAGFVVVMAATGAAARDIILTEHIDLVVSDLRMPGEMDGRALLAWLDSERPELGRTALLATGDVSGDASLALPLPPHRILNKPFEGKDYVHRVRAALGLVEVG